jgi:hypothetical protein
MLMFKKKMYSCGGLVLAFVSVDVWRSFITCQIFRETGSVERKCGSGPSIRTYFRNR